MFDASGKFIDGALYGTVSALGNFDECLEIEVGLKCPSCSRDEIDLKRVFSVEKAPKRGPHIRGFIAKYCAFSVRLPSPKSYDPEYLKRAFAHTIVGRMMSVGLSPKMLMKKSYTGSGSCQILPLS